MFAAARSTFADAFQATDVPVAAECVAGAAFKRGPAQLTVGTVIWAPAADDLQYTKIWVLCL